MYLKKFLLSILIVTKLTTINASLNCFGFPENFERDHPKLYGLLEESLNSLTAVEIFDQIHKKFNKLTISFTDECYTSAQYIENQVNIKKSMINIKKNLINNPIDIFQLILWESCNATNIFFKNNLYFTDSKDVYTFFCEASEYKSCLPFLSIHSELYKFKKNNPKSRFGLLALRESNHLFSVFTNPIYRSFKSWWEYNNKSLHLQKNGEVISHADIYRNLHQHEVIPENFENEFCKIYIKSLNQDVINLLKFFSEYKSSECEINRDDLNDLYGFLNTKKTQVHEITLIQDALSEWDNHRTIDNFPVKKLEYYRNILKKTTCYKLIINKALYFFKYEIFLAELSDPAKSLEIKNLILNFLDKKKVTKIIDFFEKPNENFNADVKNNLMRYKKNVLVLVDPIKFKENSKRFVERAMLRKSVTTEQSHKCPNVIKMKVRDLIKKFDK